MIKKENEDLAKHVTFKIGGNASNFYIPETIEELKKLITTIDNFYIISGGSNILINDKKTFENVISMEKCNSNIELQGERVYVGASVRIQKFINQINEWNYGGIEYLYSLPAMVGGCIYMNAGRGSDKKCISDYLEYVEVIDKKGNIKKIDKSDCEFAYRKSIFQKNDYIIIGAMMKFPKVDKETSKKAIQDRLQHAKEFQDMRYPNFGSVFMIKNNKIMKIVKKISFFIGKNTVCYSNKSNNWLINRGKGTFKQTMFWIRFVEILHKILRRECKREVIIWK